MLVHRKYRLITGLIALIALWSHGATAQTYTYPFEYPEPEGFTPYLENTAGPLRSEYLAAARRWPTALACLDPSERPKPAPDLTHLHWMAIRSKLDAEACLFRVFESLGTVQQARRWMVAARLQDIRIRKLPRNRNNQIELCGTNAPSQSGRVLVQTDQTATAVSQYLYGGETFCAWYSHDGWLQSTSYVVKGLGDYPDDTRTHYPPNPPTLAYPRRIPRPIYRRRGD